MAKEQSEHKAVIEAMRCTGLAVGIPISYARSAGEAVKLRRLRNVRKAIRRAYRR